MLNQVRAKYLVVGGLALNLHGVLRATKDIDLLIPRDIKNTDKILTALEGLTFGVSRELSAEEVSQKPITIVGDNPRVDLLTIAHKVKFEEAKKTALSAQIQKIKVPYVDYATLVKTKQTGRTQDKADLELLAKIKGRK
ncbi:MAG: hypothetical protein R3257_07680 [bacterium]|nr:hypothetical protein [bacterium]